MTKLALPVELLKPHDEVSEESTLQQKDGCSYKRFCASTSTQTRNMSGRSDTETSLKKKNIYIYTGVY